MNETYAMQIDAPVERVWELIDDRENLKRWMDGLEETTYPDGAVAGKEVGTRFVQRIREGGRVSEYQGVVTAYEPERHLGIRIGNRVFTMRVDYRLAPEAGGTRLDYSALMERGSAFVRIMSVLFGWFTRRILRRQMARLKAVAEANAMPSPA
ncbi:MAG TPA: SRPBCC family protein [Gemmatimonadales bacterium]|nr:SRPBCC family protein [Gemmatimonadales bacterium]